MDMRLMDTPLVLRGELGRDPDLRHVYTALTGSQNHVPGENSGF